MPDLRENEQKTLLALEKLNGKAIVNNIVKKSGLAHSAVMRAALSLAENNLIIMHEQPQTLIILSSEGKTYAETGLPERRLHNSLIKHSGEAKVSLVVEKAGIEKKFLSVALGWLNRKGWAKIKNGILTSLMIPEFGDDEKLLKSLLEKESLIVEDLSKEQQDVVSALKGRKLVEIEEKTTRSLELT